MTTIAERLAEAMQRRGLTPGMLAIKTGISDRMVRNYLKGVHHPGGCSLQKLAKGLGVSVDWLLGIKEDDQ